MTQYMFDKTKIDQHIVKYGLDIRPTIVLKNEKQKLTDYCQWLTDTLSEIFETVLFGPDRLLIQKTFIGSDNKKIELPTFVLTGRGPLYSFPIKIMVGTVEDFDLPNRERENAVQKAIKEFRKRFPDRRLVRFGVANEIIFGCGNENSFEILSSALSKERWKQGITNLKIHLENPKEGNNINVDIFPVIAQQVNFDGSRLVTRQNTGFGISVIIDINNQDMNQDLNETQVAGILGFSENYMSNELYSFLNDENG